MESIEKGLAAEIERAFGVRVPPKEPLVEPAYLNPNAQGDEGATAFFSGKLWKDLDPEGLRFHAAAMYMFTPEAHRYYLPAFMIRSLQDPEFPADYIVSHLSEHESPFWWRRIGVLSGAECEAVAAFLRAIDNGDYGGRVEIALKGLERAQRNNGRAMG